MSFEKNSERLRASKFEISKDFAQGSLEHYHLTRHFMAFQIRHG